MTIIYLKLEKIKKSLSVMIEKIVPMPSREVDSLTYWRAKILFSILFAGVLLGLVTIGFVIPMAIKDKLWGLLFFDGLFWIIGVLLLTLPRINFTIRATVSVLLMYGAGLIVIISVGPLSGGPAWLFCFSVISGVLLGYRGAVLSILANAITLLTIGLLIIDKQWGHSFPFFHSSQLMYVAGMNFLVLNTIAAISVSVLVKGVVQFYEKEKKLAKSLIKEQVELIDTKNKLEKEFQEHKQTEYALRESERKYKHLFNNAPTGMYEIDFVKDKFTNVNEILCSFTGYSENEFLSMSPIDILTKESKKLFKDEFVKLLSGEEISGNSEYKIIKKTGEIISVILHSDFVYENGKLKGTRVVVHDITELKQTEKEKIKDQEIAGEQKKLALVGQIAGKMAHDFNNILGIIMGNAELSLLDCKDTEIRKTLELIFEQTIRGQNLTKNLVAFAKDQEPKPEFFRINEKVDLVLNLMKTDLNGIKLLKEEGPNVPELFADPGMVEHTLVNLMQNSIHATSLVEYPKIMIRMYRLGNKNFFEIEDNGCGIPREQIGNIFEPSFTLKGTRDITGSYQAGIKGTGYGLANVKKYIEQQKGDILVDSDSGSGTKFTISLPVIEKELTNDLKTAINEELSPFDKYILLVEDERAISDIQYRILTQEPCNHRVDIAINGQAAIDSLNRHEYDVVSLDYILPGEINGIDVYYHIRKTSKTTPVLFISGNLEFLESIKKLKQKDAYIEHLSKPCQNKDYVNSIDKLLEKVSITTNTRI